MDTNACKHGIYPVSNCALCRPKSLGRYLVQYNFWVSTKHEEPKLKVTQKFYHCGRCVELCATPERAIQSVLDRYDTHATSTLTGWIVAYEWHDEYLKLKLGNRSSVTRATYETLVSENTLIDEDELQQLWADGMEESLLRITDFRN